MIGAVGNVGGHTSGSSRRLARTVAMYEATGPQMFASWTIGPVEK